jgi:hypothetical protein
MFRRSCIVLAVLVIWAVGFTGIHFSKRGDPWSFTASFAVGLAGIAAYILISGLVQALLERWFSRRLPP